MNDPTQSRSILITGAASGIGAATARRFIREGWHVAVNHLDASQLEAAAALAASGGPGRRGIAIEADVTR
ncbi:MAG: SDR family NAD(P)-dependent oxidoreductase, partial [Rhizobacter sp.]|nr:SDR family NAD(P)-dependent oxidoreductase [Rhizobacter sp.]